MFNKNLFVSIKNNVNKNELLQALKKHFTENVEILQVYVFSNNNMYVIGYDGIFVTKWLFKNVYDLIECSILDVGYEDVEIIEIF